MENYWKIGVSIGFVLLLALNIYTLMLVSTNKSLIDDSVFGDFEQSIKIGELEYCHNENIVPCVNYSEKN